MQKDRVGTKNYLVDIKYKHSMNSFEEFYGDNIDYSLIEQESYIDLKKMISQYINDEIKFRKFERNKMILTLRVEMYEKEMQDFENLIKENKLNFLHEYMASNIRILNE